MGLKGPKPLSPRHEMFAQKIVQGLNKSQAAAQSGFSKKTAAQIGSRLFKKVEVQLRIQELRSVQAHVIAERTAVTREWLTEQLIKNYQRAMTAEAVTDRKGAPTGVYLYQGSVANRALELLGKLTGDFTERLRPGDLDRLTEDELADAVRGKYPHRLKAI